MDFRLESCPPLCSPPPAEILGVASCKDPTWPELQTKSRTSLDIYKLLFTEGGILHIFCYLFHVLHFKYGQKCKVL